MWCLIRPWIELLKHRITMISVINSVLKIIIKIQDLFNFTHWYIVHWFCEIGSLFSQTNLSKTLRVSLLHSNYVHTNIRIRTFADGVNLWSDELSDVNIPRTRDITTTTIWIRNDLHFRGFVVKLYACIKLKLSFHNSFENISTIFFWIPLFWG